MPHRGETLKAAQVGAAENRAPTPAPPSAEITSAPFDARPSASRGTLPTILLRGVKFAAITEIECVRHILDELDAGRGGVVITPNLDHLYRSNKDLSFAALVSEADLVVADGMPLVWASRLQRTPLPERVAGSNLISSLSAGAAERGRSVYLLGGDSGTAEAAATILRQRSPNLRVVGTYCPPMGFESDQKIMSDLLAGLIAAKPDIVYVALGSPKQEQLIDRIRKVLPQTWWLGVGISFSFLCGDVKRAPRWMQVTGLEWTHRLLQEPKRLFRRYVFVCIPFGLSLVTTAAIDGFARKLRGESASDTASTTTPTTNATSPESSTHTRMLGPSRRSNDNGNGHSRRNGNGNGNGNGHAHFALKKPGDASDASSRSLTRLRSLVLLGGSVRPTALTSSIGRSVLDLPLDENGSILNHWLRHAREIAQSAGVESLRVRVLMNQTAPEPASVSSQQDATLSIERDQSEFRGTGGVLGDLSETYEDDDLILVANAAQILFEPLRDLVRALDDTGGDVSIIAHEDGTPSGIMLIRCKTLRVIPKTGFVDMKEQALPIIASRFDVRVLSRMQPSGLPLRSLSDYVGALRRFYRTRAGLPTTNDPLSEEDWHPSFAIVEDGASVDASARVHDSVILRGAIVEPHAVVVRSIVCPGATIRRDGRAVDGFVTSAQRVT